MNTKKELQNAVKSYIAGNKECFTQIYEQSYKYLHTCAIHIVKNEDIAMDMLQETYIEISQKIAQLQDAEGFLNWAATITNRKCFAYLKKQRDVLCDESGAEDYFENIADDASIIPEELLQDREKQRLVREIIDDLTDVQRLCVIGFYYNEQKQDQIAEELGIPVNTVKSHLNRAKSRIKEAVIELDEKKGTRLYSLVPFMALLFNMEANACSTPPMGAAISVAAGMGATAGASAMSTSAGAGAMSTSAGAGAMTASAGSSALGVGMATAAGAAKAAGLALKTKIALTIAGIGAAALVGVGIGTIIHHSISEEQEKSDRQTEEHDETDSDNLFEPAPDDSLVATPDLVPDDIPDDIPDILPDLEPSFYSFPDDFESWDTISRNLAGEGRTFYVDGHEITMPTTIGEWEELLDTEFVTTEAAYRTGVTSAKYDNNTVSLIDKYDNIYQFRIDAETYIPITDDISAEIEQLRNTPTIGITLDSNTKFGLNNELTKYISLLPDDSIFEGDIEEINEKLDEKYNLEFRRNTAEAYMPSDGYFFRWSWDDDGERRRLEILYAPENLLAFYRYLNGEMSTNLSGYEYSGIGKEYSLQDVTNDGIYELVIQHPTSRDDNSTSYDILAYDWQTGSLNWLTLDNPHGVQLNGTMISRYSIYEDGTSTPGWDWNAKYLSREIYTFDENLRSIQLVHLKESVDGQSFFINDKPVTEEAYYECEDIYVDAPLANLWDLSDFKKDLIDHIGRDYGGQNLLHIGSPLPVYDDSSVTETLPAPAANAQKAYEQFLSGQRDALVNSKYSVAATDAPLLFATGDRISFSEMNSRVIEKCYEGYGPYWGTIQSVDDLDSVSYGYISYGDNDEKALVIRYKGLYDTDYGDDTTCTCILKYLNGQLYITANTLSRHFSECSVSENGIIEWTGYSDQTVNSMFQILDYSGNPHVLYESLHNYYVSITDPSSYDTVYLDKITSLGLYTVNGKKYCVVESPSPETYADAIEQAQLYLESLGIPDASFVDQPFINEKISAQKARYHISENAASESITWYDVY